MPEPLRPFVQNRAKNCCEYCLSQADYSPSPFGMEHIFPTAKGGLFDPENLAWACQGCNGRKHTFTHATDPHTGLFVPLFHPRKDTWNDYFEWSEDFSRLVGVSPNGRATIVRLDLNRREVVNLRKALSLLGLHPPK